VSQRAVAASRHWTNRIVMFDYSLPAKLFLARRQGGARRQLSGRCFASAAEAIRFAVEGFPPVRTLGAWLQVGDERFDSEDINACMKAHAIPCAAERVQP
jgi:hypothetical protein